MKPAFEIITSVEQQTYVYSQLDEKARAGWSLLFEKSQRPIFTEEELRIIKGEQK